MINYKFKAKGEDLFIEWKGKLILVGKFIKGEKHFHRGMIYFDETTKHFRIRIPEEEGNGERQD